VNKKNLKSDGSKFFVWWEQPDFDAAAGKVERMAVFDTKKDALDYIAEHCPDPTGGGSRVDTFRLIKGRFLDIEEVVTVSYRTTASGKRVSAAPTDGGSP